MSTTHRPQFLSWIASILVLLCIPAAFSTSLMDPWNLPRLIGLAVFLGGAVAWTAFQKDAKVQFPQAWLGLVGVWILGMGVSVWQAPNLGDALYFGGMRVAMLALIVWLSGRKDPEKIAVSLALFGSAEAVLGMAEVLGWVDMKTLAEIPVGTAGNPNLYGSLLTLILPVAGMLCIAERKPLQRAGIVAVALILAGAVLSGSSAVFLALGLMALLFAGLMLFARRMRGRPMRWSLIAGILPMMIIVAPILWALLDFDHTTRVGTAMTSVTERGFLWREAASMVAERPLLGTGLGGWRYEILQHGIVAPSTTFGTRYYADTHNDFLGQAVESGLLTGLAYAGIWLLLFVLAVRQGIATEDRRVRIRAFLLANAVVGWCVFSGFHFPMQRMDHLIVVAAIAALILQNETSGWRPRPVMGRGLQLGLAGLCFAIAAFGWSRFVHEQHVAKVYAAKHAGDWRIVLRESNLAENVFCTTEHNSVTPIAWFRGLALYQMQNYPQAKSAFLQAAVVNPHHPHVLNNLASTYVAINQLDSAIFYYDLARANFPEFPDPYLNSAQIYQAIGDTSRAIEVLSAYPDVPSNGKEMCRAALEKLR